MTKHTAIAASLDEMAGPRMVEGRPEGFLEHEADTAIRDLIRVYGFKEARAFVADVLNRESKGRYS